MSKSIHVCQSYSKPKEGRFLGDGVHFWGLLPPDGILPGAKFTLHASLAFSYIGNVTARHSSSWRQPNFAAWYKEWNYGTFADSATYIQLGGHHTAFLVKI